MQKQSRKVQTANPEVSFVILDGEPTTMADNTLAIYFAEEQAKIFTGVAAALQSENWKSGIYWWNEASSVETIRMGILARYCLLRTKLMEQRLKLLITNTKEHLMMFKVDKMVATPGMYDKGIDIIFTAAAAVKNGVINACGAQISETGDNFYVIGVECRSI